MRRLPVNIIQLSLTKFVVTRESLELTNEALKRKAPPRSHRPKKEEKIIDMEGSVMVWFVICAGIVLF
jgi:hypothetical protein